MKVKQTAGRDSLGEFAPKFAELNDVLVKNTSSDHGSFYSWLASRRDVGVLA